MILSLLGSTAAAATLPGSLELLALTVGGVLPPRRLGQPVRTLRRLSIVIPAHNEAASITACLRSLQLADRPATPCDFIVIADNCLDDTASRARGVGATVWERRDDTARGKGFALEFAFQRLMSETDTDAVLIVDADTEVAPNFLTASEAAFAAGAEAVQSAYHVKNIDDSTRTRLMNVAFLAFNVLRPRGRARWGLSAGILGNGWGMSRTCLQSVPYNAHSVVEDLEHHIALVRAGFKVEFLHDTYVRAEMPSDDKAADTQRARWEGGRFRMIREHVPSLLRQAATGTPRALEPAFELMLLPLAYHVAGLGVALVIPFPPSQLYALGGLGVVAAHVAAGLAVGGADLKDIRALAAAPRYMLWKAGILPAILSASVKDQAWVRTLRAAEQ
ncbi:MAG: glycosyltransferase family 2 protein [Myxococcales bacterium]|nr:glycosyltransferase family 2 protein [Myxococcales bacterium]